MWFLMAGRVHWRTAPPAFATSLYFVGMQAVFSVIFSGMVTSYTQKYRSIGTVFALMSWLIAIGVVILLGAAAGLVWQERGLSKAGVTKSRRVRLPQNLLRAGCAAPVYAGLG